ncbi:MAG: hypothetical protein JWP91_404 [Fibrobacteres bacterium]|nr:hypothetical protein [Fibrobacterota bacterium]
MTKWQHYALTGDDFLVAFYALPNGLDQSRLFLVGHALELYLKGVLFSLLNDANLVRSKGHKIVDLLRSCQSEDPKFLPDYVIRDSVLDALPLSIHLMENLAPSDYVHFGTHRDLYQTIALGPDAKYWGTPLTRPNLDSVFEVWPNNYWEKMFKNIFQYLGHSPENCNLILSRGGFTSTIKDVVNDIFRYEPRIS